MFGVAGGVVYIPSASQAMKFRCPEIVRVFCVWWGSEDDVLVWVITEARQAVCSPDLYTVTCGECLVLLEPCNGSFVSHL
jgi:hypothetical protein